ncbi:MAG TPA: TraB/GumN family protein, partial [Vicinamibacterales bacterium]|nr:TraB/GumN family protein [Vicinamibacterales bacterium]
MMHSRAAAPLKRRPTIPIALAAAALLVLLAGAPARAQTHSFLWKASKGPSVVYLLGSVHLLSKDFYPLNPALEAAYANSALLVEEVDMGEMLNDTAASMKMLSRGMLPAGQSLEKVISAPTRALVTKTAGDLGVPMAPLALMKPWMAAMTLEAMEWQKAGFEADLGLDLHFYNDAKTDNKPVQGLETVDYQLSIFDD